MTDMRGSHFLAIAVLIIPLMLTACGLASGEGPQTWIDNPQKDSTLPLSPLAIQAHAADVDGIEQIDFFVDGELHLAVNANGGRLADAIYEWTPPGPGRYTLGVQAADNSGNTGQLAISNVIISGSQAIVPTQEAPEDTETAAETVAVSDTPTHSPTATQASAPTSQPLATQTFTPTTQQSSATDKPTSTNTATVFVPPPDTTPPVIAAADVTPSQILTDSQGCQSYSRTVSVKAVVGDETAMGGVVANWSVGGESGQVSMFKGDIFYEGFVGPVNTTGNLSIIVIAEDSSGNTSQSGTMNVTVNACIE